MTKTAVAVLVAAAAIHIHAQQDQTPIFRAGTTLVELTIVATDQNGKPITDLKQEDVAILQNGKPQPVAFFRFEGAAFGPDAAEAAHEPLAPGVFTNRPEYSPGPARNVTAIVIDSLNTLPEDQVAVRAQVMQYLRALAPNTRVAIYSVGSTFRIVHDFSADLNALRARLAKLPAEYNIQPVPADQLVRRQAQEAEHLDTVSQGDSSETDQDAQADAGRQAELDKRTTQTVALLEALGNHLAGIPGRRNLVWIGGGIPVLTQGAYDRWVKSYSSQIRGVAQRLATQGISVYPVQATGLENQLRIWGTMDILADVTGGRAFKNTNDLTAGASAAANDVRGSYSVGFYVPDSGDHRWHGFDVRVSRPGVSVLHRKGYMALAPVKQPVNWVESEWQAAMQTALGANAIRLDARVDAVPYGVNVVIQIAADDLYYKTVKGQPVTDLEIGFGERNPRQWTRVRRDGATITVKENPQATVKPSIVRFAKVWSVEPDTSHVRLIVRDRMTGRFGSLDMPLAAIRR